MSGVGAVRPALRHEMETTQRDCRSVINMMEGTVLHSSNGFTASNGFLWQHREKVMTELLMCQNERFTVSPKNLFEISPNSHV